MDKRRRIINFGDTFDKVTVLYELDRYQQECGSIRRRFWVKCDCGEEFSRTLESLTDKRVITACTSCTNLRSRDTRVSTRLKLSVDELQQYRSFCYIHQLISKRPKLCTVTILDLYKLWHEQNGICAYSKVKLILPEESQHNISPNYRASIDRIDSDLGYSINNIHYVSVTCNYAKNSMSHIEMLEFVKILSKS